MYDNLTHKENGMSIHQTATRLPSFEGKNEKGQTLSSLQLIGRKVLIYFYLKDDTSICTEEACSLKNSMNIFRTKNVQVIGISPDSEESHQLFSKKHGLNFPLISDPDLTIASLFGAVETGADNRPKLVRATFLVDSAGRVVWKEQPVSIEGHIERILKALESIK